MKLAQLYSDRILVKELVNEERMGHIIVPTRSVDKTTDLVEIVFIGDLKKPASYPMDLQVGDKVLVSRGRGMHITKYELGIEEEGKYRIVVVDSVICRFARPNEEEKKPSDETNSE